MEDYELVGVTSRTPASSEKTASNVGCKACADVEELLAVDMGCVGDDLAGNEFEVSICAKDGGVPYDYDMTNKLIQIAKERKLGYVVDVFPHYGSDVGAALKGGNNIRGALIGQGVHASHGTERTHVEGLKQTLLLVEGYIGMEKAE